MNDYYPHDEDIQIGDIRICTYRADPDDDYAHFYNQPVEIVERDEKEPGRSLWFIRLLSTGEQDPHSYSFGHITRLVERRDVKYEIAP